jgi:hypothetical protein
MRTNRIQMGRRGRRGVALVTALVTAFVAAAMIMVMITVSRASNDVVQVVQHSTEARFLGEGSLEIAKQELRFAMANSLDERVPDWYEDSAEEDQYRLEWDREIAGEEVTYEATAYGPARVEEDSAGIQTIVRPFRLEARCESFGSAEPVRRIVDLRVTPIFQFAVFYTEDLEINPGPNMTLGGRVHSNADMYLGCNNTLTIDTNYLRAAGGIYRNRKDSPGASNGTVRVRKWVENPFDPSEPSQFVNMNSKGQMSGSGVPTVSGYDSNFEGYDANGDGDFTDSGDWLPWGPGALDMWGEPSGYLGGSGQTVLSQEHGTTIAEAPGIGSIAMYEEVDGGSHVWDPGSQQYVATAAGEGTHSPGYFHANADLSIITYDDGTWDAFDGNGISIKGSLVAAGVVDQTTMYDARQSSDGTKSPICEIDIAALNASGVFPANGLLYAAHYGMGQGTDAKGVLLHNGSELAGPLTVVSEGPLYVQGDYNTVDKKGASVIGDAVNLLSNSWTGSKNKGQLPSASNTTFNMAIVTGNHETSVGDYNGGLENLPRFHENWGGKDCNINGSFVNAWQSRHATGEWSYGGDIYKAPRRNWSYDTFFNDVDNLPPFTPRVVTAVDVVSW